MTQGQTDAPKQETPKPFVEKIGEPKPVDNPAAKIAPKEITASTDATPPPSPPEPKQEAKKKAEPKRDLIAEALKKDDAKKSEQKKADAKVPTPPKRPPSRSRSRNPSSIRGRSRRCSTSATPQRKQATGDTINDTPALGTRARLSARSSRRTNSTRCARGSRNCGIRPPARRTRRSSWSRSACA